jgi:hypothetical protein
VITLTPSQRTEGNRETERKTEREKKREKKERERERERDGGGAESQKQMKR